ncbi:MAG: T9SS type A sorting domain-containing protein [Candidatus Stahlbacteria bacterium]|nr:T9SS type A sorting domain-containing protein [Candidatus Stahlbacteria bacterium]
MSKRIYFALVGAMFLGSVAEGYRWSRTGDINDIRQGFASAMFTEGRILLFGGYLPSPLGYPTKYEVFDPSTGIWTQEVSPDSGDHPMALLLPNGKVITWAGNNYYDLYNPQNSTWQVAFSAPSYWWPRCCATLLNNQKALMVYTGSAARLYNCWNNSLETINGPNGARKQASAEVLLPDGKVLLAGGINNGTQCEIFDPTNNTWSYTGPFNNNRYKQVMVLLPAPWNKVLAAGSQDGTTTCELYNIGAGTWAITGAMNYSHKTPGMVLLPNGKPLIVGGRGAGSHKKCELFDPNNNTWQETDTTMYPKNHFNLGILYTGKVLAIGTVVDDWTMSKECEIYDPSIGRWIDRTTLLQARRAHTVTILPIIHTTNCSTTVLVVGGETSSGVTRTCELYNYRSYESSNTGLLNTARAYHTATLLPSTNVFVTGGKITGGAATASCELFNMGTEQWSPAATLGTARFDQTATLLKDSRILVTGGEGGGYLGSCEIYNGTSWAGTGNMNTARARHCAVLLFDGRVMVIGGETSAGVPTAACEIWNGTSWSQTTQMNTARSLHTAILLQNGKILVIGGRTTGGAATASCEVYNPANNSWQVESNLNVARYAHNATLLYSGLVFVSGGYNGTYIGDCEIWDPAAELNVGTGRHSWKVHTTFGGRAYHASVLIPSDKPYIVAIGGYNGGYLNNIQEYDVGLDYQQAWQSTITSHKAVTSISDPMTVAGTLFRGVSEADGGNYSHIVSSDHPIMSLVRAGGGNWQGNGGGDLMYMPYSDNWNATGTIIHPSSPAQGYYKIWAIVNGIPTKWYGDCVNVEEENSKQGYFVPTVFPSPSMGSVMFNLGNIKGNTNITIYDCTGRIVRSITATPGTNEVKLSELKTGIYFYRIENRTDACKGKFVVL